jgi:quercetin dioxygenase-like cupin family protein
MEFSRRDVALLLLAAGQTRAADKEKLPTAVTNRDEITPRKSGQSSQRKFFDGLTHENIPFEVHETELPPGQAPHPPHKHVHEEMCVVTDGALEVFIEGRGTKKLTRGGVVYVASNELHGWKNADDGTTRYLVIAVGHD